MIAFGRLSLLLALILAAVMPLKAETDLSVTGQVRARGIADKTTFGKDANFDIFDELRTRLTAHAVVDGNSHAFIQLQDSRVHGEGGFSGTTQAGNNVDLHQGYLQIDNLFGNGFGSKAGRFEFVKGNERVFGAVGWSNVARSWDGGMFWWDAAGHKIIAFGATTAERHNELMVDNSVIPPAWGESEDKTVGILYATIKEWNWDIFVAGEIDAAGKTATDYNALERFSIGTYYQRTHEQLDFTLNAVVQTGKVSDTIDISGSMFAFEAGYSLQDERNSRLAAGFDYQSGDDGSDPLKTKSYSGLYPTAHKFQGYMDYFTGVPVHGLIDLMFRYKTDFLRGWTVKADIHYFKAAEDYMWDDDNSGATADVASSDVGIELDITVKTNRVAGVDLQWGVSYFGAKDSFAGMSDKDPGLWAYGMTTVSF